MPQKKDYLSARELSSKYLIKSTRDTLLSKDAWSYKFKGLKESPRGDKRGTLDVRVSPQNISKALNFMEAFIEYGLERGHDIIVKYDETRIVIKGQEEKASFRERTRVIERDPADKNGSRQYEPTGVLTFKASWHFEWKEGTNSQTLIEQIPKMYEKLEARIETLLAGWERSRIAREKEEIEERAKLEIKNRKKRELSDFKNLLDQSRRWHRVRSLREYILEVAKQNANEDTSLAPWLEWANSKVNWYDPMIEEDDALLIDVNRDTLEFTSK